MIVVFPYSPVDQELATKLSKWIAELGKNEGHRVLIVRDIRCNPNYDSSIKHDLGSVFDSVEVITMTERLDSWPLAPNRIFAKAAKHIQYTNPEPWLWCEGDCVPLKPGWVEALWKEYQVALSKGKYFVGDFVNVPNVIPHLSGIAIYPDKVVDYAGSAVMALDTAWDVESAGQVVPQMYQTHLISHKWKFPKLNNQSEVDNLLAQLGDAVLFHQDKTGSLIDFLRERKYPKPQQNPVQSSPSAGIGTTDIFIKTYPKDYPWLNWCLLSIGRFTSGFKRVIIISPSTVPGQTSFVSPEHGNDNYLSQQAFKMYADTFTDADNILHIDSDTIFTCPVTPETYFKDGKLVIMITPIDQAHPDEQNAWRRVMHKFMGKPSDYEFMRRFPILYPRWAYAALREFCVKQHGVELDKYIMAQPYREFSEFNCMGFFLHEFHREKFTWIDTSKIPESEWPELTVDQQWSHNPIPVEKWEKILDGGHGNNKRVESGLRGSRSLSEVPKPIIQTILGSEDNKRSEQIKPNGTPDPSLPELLGLVAKYFSSPLAKGRIFKQLKAFPIVK